MHNDSFLYHVAHDLYRQYGADLSRVAVVFPNKRANLFFNEHLAAESDSPIWSPAYFSISELLQGFSSYEMGDPVQLVCELYKVFATITKSEETLDEFYFWGELLISDFDDIDKNLVQADSLFVNLRDLKAITTDHSYITPEQEEAIRQFFINFSVERQTTLKERFLSLWGVLGDIYKAYRAALSSRGIAYEGMLYRSVIETLDTDGLPYDKYVFVGFNVLNAVEQRFFQTLKKAGKALFYWDYDRFYLDKVNHEAGEFIRRNLIQFPSSLPDDLFDNLAAPRKIQYISAPTENAQARFLPGWLRETIGTKEEETAVVLCNEALLLPVLHSIPPEVRDVNITMGFPLAQTPVYSFINSLLDLQAIGYRAQTGRYLLKYVTTILHHPYSSTLSAMAEPLGRELVNNNRFYPFPAELKRDEYLSLIFTPRTGNEELCTYLTEILQMVAGIYRAEPYTGDVYSQLYRESLFKAYTTVARFHSLIEEGDLTINTETFRRLLNKVMGGINIPFHGEPAVGLQVMGVLETRNLDFRNLVMLSVNEGKMPKSGGDASFIPYNLRKAFGMNTIEQKDAVYAYYFYRLLQRAENVTLLYNTSTDGMNRGEWSRYMLQFLIEWPHEIERLHLEAGQSPQVNEEISIDKTPEVMRKLQSRFDIRVNERTQLSPSALNTYLDCSLKFYFHYVAELEPLKEISSDIDSPTFGSIFHKAAELLYRDLTVNGKLIRKEDIDPLLRDEIKLKSYVDNAFKEVFFKIKADEKTEYNGLQLINSEVIYTYLRQLLTNDLRYTPFALEAMELPVKEEINIHTPKGIIKSRIGGYVDRLDSKDGTLRIVDYKTGGKPKVPRNIEALFTPGEERPGYIFQTFLYAAIMTRRQELKVAPALLYIHQAASDDYSPVIQMGEPRKAKEPVEDFSLYQQEFRERLQVVLEEIFNPELPFRQTEATKLCEYCSFKSICKR